jgi:hypothetical protein
MEDGMSRLEVYAVNRDGDVHHYADCQNSWGGWMHIWHVYGQRMGLIHGPGDIGRMMMTDGFGAIWQRTPELPEGDQWVMRGTFDRVMIRKEDLVMYRVWLCYFCVDATTPTLEELILVLDRAIKDDAVCALCFNGTSVSENPWRVYDGTNRDEYGDDEGRPYNINRDRHHWWIHAPDEPLPVAS